jgi:hypothetical protein
MRQIVDYLILSLLCAVMFSTYGYIFSTAGMICLYATVYAMMGNDNKEEDNESSY